MYYSDSLVEGGLAAAFAATWFIWLIFCILLIVANWKIFEKAGYAGWKSIIPLYNLYIQYKIAWGNGWLFLLNIIPIVNIIVSIIFEVKLAKAFGKSGGFAVGLIFLPYIFQLVLGFDSSQYIGPQ